jgi:hypothetical protein
MDLRRRQGNDAHALAVAQAFRSDRFAGSAVRHADQIGRRDGDGAVAPANRELILRGDLEDRTGIAVQAGKTRTALAESGVIRPQGRGFPVRSGMVRTATKEIVPIAIRKKAGPKSACNRFTR